MALRSAVEVFLFAYELEELEQSKSGLYSSVCGHCSLSLCVHNVKPMLLSATGKL